jgi:hypothetical protein
MGPTVETSCKLEGDGGRSEISIKNVTIGKVKDVKGKRHW